MSDFRWALWASLCVAWCFGMAGFIIGRGAGPLAVFPITVGVFCLKWASMCWTDHLGGRGNG